MSDVAEDTITAERKNLFNRRQLCVHFNGCQKVGEKKEELIPWFGIQTHTNLAAITRRDHVSNPLTKAHAFTAWQSCKIPYISYSIKCQSCQWFLLLTQNRKRKWKLTISQIVSGFRILLHHHYHYHHHRVACHWMNNAVSMSNLDAEVANTSAEMSPVARQANAGKLGGRKPDNSLESPLGRPNTPNRYTYRR